VAEVPDQILDAVEQRMAQLDPQAEVCLDLSCPECDHRWQMNFDIANFVWSQVVATARRVLREVDLLARTYGWSEDHVLALSPFRRQAYLDLAGS
jgi:hypothetical protein